MTRKEYYETRKLWRTVQSMISSKPQQLEYNHLESDKENQISAAWGIIYKAVYLKAHPIMEATDRKYLMPSVLVTKPKTRIDMKMNIKYAPNSHPHKTRTP